MIYLVSNTPYEKEMTGIKHLRVCEIKFYNFNINLNEFDALVLTSKNAVFSLKYNKIDIRKNIKVYAIGQGSFDAAKDAGFSDIYLAKNAHGNEFAYEILPYLNSKKILYLKAKETVSDLVGILKNNDINLTTVEAYENSCLVLDKKMKPEENSILIFTSPKNVKCFIKNFGWDESWKVISIGKTTQKYLLDYTKPYVCENQTIKACIDKALLIL